ncbi:Retrovirus-related Pol polyprotein from transposon 17.6 [Eumeta japonica]|uniref:Retrovirus-related Pol polyprotein from transposon 17.6 n=1 Tax=Eumeta variegata TaxID=151549 RepID=A0A4C1WT94_EUMVA|nr:Retrovirus-related Pol polyprotein from transposon 17.6 [Eumeta japonica]
MEKKTGCIFFKKLNEAQKKKKAIYLECLAIKEAVKYWQYWLIGKHFTVYSDHKPLENMNIKSRIDEELGEFTYYLSQYDFKIKYAPGKDNLEADCLSRNPVLEAVDDTDEQLRIVNLIQLQDVVTDQEKNENIQRDMVYVENGHKLNRRKLDELRIGPYRIEEKISDTIYRINTGHKKLESNLFHITKLIPIPV